ncbi:MAG TPA: M50 family metallopeptidase, partial [Gemmataceae bacterium]|nr:M50 family metallopeptidase [Gemmataceae bacterium]
RARWQRIAVSAAGPAIQLLFYGLLRLLLKWQASAEHPIHLAQAARFTLGCLLLINLYWALFNLLPIWPLDGGMIAREVISGFSRDRGVVISLFLSMIVSATLAVNEFIQYQRHPSFLPSWLSMGGDLYMAIFFAIFAINNYFEWQALRYQHRDVWEEERW